MVGGVAATGRALATAHPAAAVVVVATVVDHRKPMVVTMQRHPRGVGTVLMPMPHLRQLGTGPHLAVTQLRLLAVTNPLLLTTGLRLMPLLNRRIGPRRAMRLHSTPLLHVHKFGIATSLT